MRRDVAGLDTGYPIATEMYQHLRQERIPNLNLRLPHPRYILHLYLLYWQNRISRLAHLLALGIRLAFFRRNHEVQILILVAEKFQSSSMVIRFIFRSLTTFLQSTF
jgi:hypothetical protein